MNEKVVFIELHQKVYKAIQETRKTWEGKYNYRKKLTAIALQFETET